MSEGVCPDRSIRSTDRVVTRSQLRFDDIGAALERTRAAVLGQRLLPED